MPNQMRHEPSTLLGKTTNPQNQIENLKIKLKIKKRFVPTYLDQFYTKSRNYICSRVVTRNYYI